MNKSNKTAPQIAAHANEVLSRIGILENPYFKTLRNGEMPLGQFRKTQEQFYFAVVFFSRPMSALVGRIPNAKDRLDILHNVLEEHGELNEDNFHATIFQKFLKSIGSDVEDFEQVVLSPQVRAFNSVLTTSCTFDELEVGIACMGIIERAFADISALIGKSMVARNWVKEEELYHYKLHADLDIQHAEEFFAVIERFWEDEKKQYFIKQGLELGAYIFDRLYRDLLTVS